MMRLFDYRSLELRKQIVYPDLAPCSDCWSRRRKSFGRSAVRKSSTTFGCSHLPRTACSDPGPLHAHIVYSKESPVSENSHYVPEAPLD